MRLRPSMLFLALLALGVALVALGAPRAIVAPRLQAKPVLSAQVLRTDLSKALQIRQVPNRAKVLTAVEKLPPGAKETVAALFDPKTALAINRPELTVAGGNLIKVSAATLEAIKELLKQTPMLSSLLPQGGGQPSLSALAMGSGYNSKCKVVFNGTVLPTACVSGSMLWFIVPGTAVAGHTYPVQVRNTQTNRNSATINWKVVAPRGYRGVYGLGFPNFSAATIPWSVYRHCFGASTVEFPNGTHRPSADAWYNSTYKGMGYGGNCFGMSLLSLRIRQYQLGYNTHALDTVVYGSWIRSHMPWAPWALPWNTQMKQSVQECQAYQVCEPIASYTVSQKSAQNNVGAWNTANTAVHTEHEIVQNSTYGHAVVTYDTITAGTTRTFRFYDNNHPYSETETGGPHKSLGTVNSATGSFSYGGYTKIATYHLSGISQTPHLPPGVGGAGDHAADSAFIEAPRDGTLTITDERGRGGRDGAGIPGFGEIVIEGGLRQMPGTYPRIFVLLHPTGRSLNINFAGQGARPRQLSYFGRGVVLEATANGQQLQASMKGMGAPDASMQFANPGLAKLAKIRMIGVLGAGEERLINVDNFTWKMGASAARFGFTPDRAAAAISLAGGTPMQLRLQLESHAAAGISRSAATAQTAQVGRLNRFTPGNWRNLQQGAINRGLLNLPPGGLR